jgi:hypothetical protein
MKTKLILLLILAVALVESQATPKGCEIVEKWDFNNWKVWSIILLLASVAIASIFIMIARFIGKPELAEAAKMDLQQILITAVFLLIFSSLALFICKISTKDLGFDKDMGVFEAAENYFEYSKNVVLSELARGASLSMYLSALQTLSTGFAMPYKAPGSIWVASLYFSPLAGLNTYNLALRLSTNLIQLSFAAQVGYIVLLKTIQLSFLNMLLPIGIILRCFTPTRNVGGILISLAFGLFLFYPLIFAFFYAAIGFPSPEISTPNHWWDKLIVDYLFVATQVLFGMRGLIYVLLYALANVYLFAFDVADYVTGLGSAILYTFIIPAIAWIVIGAAIRDLSRFFGEEIDISSLARMI